MSKAPKSERQKVREFCQENGYPDPCEGAFPKRKKQWAVQQAITLYTTIEALLEQFEKENENL